MEEDEKSPVAVVEHHSASRPKEAVHTPGPAVDNAPAVAPAVDTPGPAAVQRLLHWAATSTSRQNRLEQRTRR